MIECALIQAALWHPETWRPFLLEILTLGDFQDHVNFMAWRAFLLTDGDFVQIGHRMREELRWSDYERWVSRYCGSNEFFVYDEPPVEEMFDLLRQDHDEALVEFCSRWSLWS